MITNPEWLESEERPYFHQISLACISKWEEALARDPGKLEAKFNIEIAEDRIKEKEIHEELKTLLIQRK